MLYEVITQFQDGGLGKLRRASEPRMVRVEHPAESPGGGFDQGRFRQGGGGGFRDVGSGPDGVRDPVRFLQDLSRPVRPGGVHRVQKIEEPLLRDVGRPEVV